MSAKTKTVATIDADRFFTIKWRAGKPIVNPMLAQQIVTEMAETIGQKNMDKLVKVNATAHFTP